MWQFVDRQIFQEPGQGQAGSMQVVQVATHQGSLYGHIARVVSRMVLWRRYILPIHTPAADTIHPEFSEATLHRNAK